MPLGGWTCRELQKVLGLSSPTKTTQSFEPAVRKVAVAMLADPLKTLQALAESCAEIEGVRARRSPMSPKELDLRRRILEGRVDSSELTQRAEFVPPIDNRQSAIDNS